METSNIGLIYNPIIATETRIKYVLYARKSTESDEQQALSIDSQVKEMTAIAERLKLNVVAIKRESHSAKASGQRPVFRELLEEINKGIYNGILTWAPDRLSRNAGDLGKLVDRIDQNKLVQIKTFGQTFSNSPSDKFLLMILCSQAKLENDNKSINVKRGMRTRCEMGLWPAQPPTGYRKVNDRTAKCEVEIDPDRADIIRQIFEKIAYDKWSVSRVYAWLKFEINFKTFRNHNLSLGNVFRIIDNTFYYGKFEYPRGGGIWYEGKHKPIITKELFDETRNSIKSQVIKSQGKEFAFTRIMKCELCGSGITADEKFKQHKDGTVSRYVYYKCTRVKDSKCKSGYINEDDLIKQLQNLIDDLDIQTVPMREKISEEVKRFKNFERMLLGRKTPVVIKDIDIRNYAKFILQEGSTDEKRDFLRYLKSEIIFTNKIIKLK